jgi:TetR/AcrR family transcriptional regulator
MARDQKREAVIKAAEKRFSHFGVSKTTMNEIADDLSISKASLYYYFPDKLSLYAAVLEKVIEPLAAAEANTKTITDPKAAIMQYLENRTEFIIQYYNILEHLKTLGTIVPKELKPVFTAARTRELKSVTAIFEEGAAAKKLQIEDPKKVAGLFLDCLDGLRNAVLLQKKNFFPDRKQLSDLLKREKEFANIFVLGLSR